MEKTGGEIVAKQGAEGIFCMGQNSEGLGVAIKVEDGAHRALDPVVVSLLNDLNVLSASAAPLTDLLEPVVRNHRKEIIGYLTVIKP
jgi:L-asparaginase II